MKNSNYRGFALLEVLLVITALFILTGVAVFAFNPGDKLGDKNNMQRRVDVSRILDAVSQYAADNHGTLPRTITATSTEICKTGGNCAGLINLSVLTANEKYLSVLPIDPAGGSTNGITYMISKDDSGQVTVSAPLTDNGETIFVRR
ncbi:MAG: type II secretion system protein [Patescibacteria group bacterium]